MTDSTPGILVCINHPDRETYLRCNRCNNPICIKCAVLTPTGYRCKDCVRGRQRAFETAQTLDPYIAVGIALVISFLGSFVAGIMLFFTIFIAPMIGMITAEIIRRAVNRRRSRLLFQLSAAGAVIGGLPLLVSGVLGLIGVFTNGSTLLSLIWPLIWQGVYIFLVATTLYYRLSGIRV
jgi:thiol:disulfide interchange protein